MELLINEVGKMKEKVSQELNLEITDEKAFVFLCLKLFYAPKDNCRQLFENITDGSSDGGLDFIFFDEEEQKIHVCQCKYSDEISADNIINEFSKIENTINDFRRLNTSRYNAKVRELLQNAIDRFDENAEVVEYNLFTKALVNIEYVNSRIESLDRGFSINNTNIFGREQLTMLIEQQATAVERVSDNFRLRIDSAGNHLQYETENVQGAFINVSSDSIRKMYNKYINKGLLDQNIRKFVANKTVDSGIKHTLANERDRFWFYNNGITIACEEFHFDGYNVEISNFSIINGGQTTTLIGKDENSTPFSVPCKLISYRGRSDLISKISEATNSQKPIQPRDLKSDMM